MLGRLFLKVGAIALDQGLSDGFRTVVNTGRVGGQEVYHLHAHILGGPQPVGPLLVRR
jgi:histidine triad (HIT) family protein